MAYIKFKELTHYFNFNKQLEISELPDYVKHYMSEGETVVAAYSTLRDKCVFTDRKLILFDRHGNLGSSKKIHFFPYKNISTSAILFKGSMTAMLFTMNSGYQVRINFVRMDADAKAFVRKVYYNMIEKI